MNNLGDYYQYGIGVPIDINKSIYYYQEAIEKGNLDIAKINLAMLFFEKINSKKSPNKTIELLLDATNSDNLEMRIVAMTNLGGVYKHLGYNVEAFVWTKKAAELDSEVAETNLGFLFSEGIGTKPNAEKALYWLNKAMDKKYPEAFFILATIYKNGSKSIEKNYFKALELYSIASDLDHGMAKNNLANMLFNGQGIEPDRLRALNLYLDAANSHNIAFSMYALYQIYSRGYEEIPKDLEEAKYWLEKAKENGLDL
ncbi:SEL1-like repeat protein [Volucribacter amazonae]|uniref:TPR repeat protein n=1 Tax=Volucribacter amazonae TaxID=256731 RepID=A0A9X4SIZ9_9PAST|nr:SEL1-like repeat protein [Volucribacter amazonae]MDG6896220.1 hypothetical protein [Volucribacter amazonae]